jgi:2-polyprenyl-3-methyl-5-hydroxy-6-metoxy-1,4-benzoquinol methylase
LLESDRLDGPLVKCSRCGLAYVGARQDDLTFSTLDEAKSRSLSERVKALGLVDEQVEAGEAPARRKLFAERLAWIKRFVISGRLLEIGCARGEFLELAADAGFEAQGIEPDPATSAVARDRRRLRVCTGTLSDAAIESESFDLVVLFHVLEHLDSPRRTIAEIHRVLKPGGFVIIETPNIQTRWFRIFGKRWRQLIPDHYFFFSPPTLTRLLEACGFAVCEITHARKVVSLRLIADRIRRLNAGLGKVVGSLVRAVGLADMTVGFKLSDIMLVCARKKAANETHGIRERDKSL